MTDLEPGTRKEVQWGTQRRLISSDTRTRTDNYSSVASEADAEKYAREDAEESNRAHGDKVETRVVRRTVTYGEWEAPNA